MKIRQRIMLVMVALIAVTAAAFTAIAIEIQKRTLLEGIDRKLLTAATLAKNILPEGYHDDIADSASVSRAEYLGIVERYDRLCRELDVQYLWSLMAYNGKIVFTSGTSTGKDASRGDFASFFDVHTNPGAYDEAFRTMRVQYSTFHDKWGRGRMVLIPNYDHHGRKYLFAASMGTNEVGAALFRTVQRMLLVSLAVLAVAVFFAFLLANSLSRPIVRLTRAARSIAEGDLRQAVNVRGARELQSLSESINVMSGAIRDKITELRASTENLDTTLNSIGDGVIVTDIEGRVTRMNPVAEHLTGWTREDALGHPLGEVFRIINSQTRQPVDDPVDRVLESGRVVGLANHTALISRDGAERQIADSAAPIRDSAGRTTGAVLVFHDVSWEYAARESLRESELRFRTLFEEAQNPIFVADEDGRYVDANRAGLEFLECRREELLAGAVWSFTPPDSLEAQRKRHSPFLERRTVETDYRVGGTVKTLLLNIIPLNLSGRVHLYGIGQDITERKREEAALRLSEEKFSKAFLASPCMIAISEPDTGKYIEVNEVFLETFGYRREEVIGRTFLDLESWIEPEDRVKAMLLLRDGGVVQNIQARFRRRDGETIYGLLSMGTTEFAGKPVILSVANDLTPQKRAERELREKSELLNSVLQVAPVGIALVEKHSICWTNDSMLRLFGYSREEIFNRSSEMLYTSPEEFREVVGRLNSMLRENAAAQTEAVFRRKDGSIMHGLIHLSVFDPSAPEKRAIAAVTDITWRKQAENALAGEKERLLVTLRSIGDAVIATDTGGKVTLMNRVAEELTGWPQAEAMGKPLNDIFRIINERTRATCANPVDKVLESNTIVGLANHTALISRDGIERSIEDSGAPIRDSSGAVMGVVLVFRDVTVKRRLEEELQKTQNLESVGVLAGGIAHDFNNILTGILGNISLARLNLEPEHESHPILMEVEEETCRARDLTQQLLTFSKGGAPIRKVTSVSELLRTTANFALRGSRSRCEFSIPEDLWPAMVDEGQVCQVISNLVINADQAMPQGGIIRMSAENVRVEERHALPLQEGLYIRISVADHGSGIPREHLPRIFDPYFSTKEKGHGLGLATTHSIVRRHDGHIRVETEPGVGSTFQVYFPALERRSVPRAQEERFSDPGFGKIMVMDDEETIRFTTGELLVRYGYTVETVRDGAEAVERYRAAHESGAPFSLVIMDLTVPGGMGGLEALSRMREIDPEVRAIVSSGYSGDPVMAEYARYGFSGVAAKPYRFKDLIRVIRSILDR